MMDKFYIKKFIRDDGQVFEFDASNIYLAKDNQLISRPIPRTTAIDYTEANGGEMIRQQNPVFEQLIKGIIVPTTKDYWTLVSELSSFWQINHTFKIIFKKKDGGLFSEKNAWISSGLQITQTPHEDYSYWEVGLNIGNDNWIEYAEDSEGHEIYANSVEVPLVTLSQGGEEWDSVGLVYDSLGEVWTSGSGGVQPISVNSTKDVYPIWVVEGECINPSIRSNTTDTVATYSGTVAAGQTLTVNFEEGTADLDGSIVSRNITGTFKCKPGTNMVAFSSDGGDTTESVIKWNNIVS